jgi:hypothetical protein
VARKVLDDQNSRQHQRGEHRHPARPGPASAAPALADDVIHGATAKIRLIRRHDDTRARATDLLERSRRLRRRTESRPVPDVGRSSSG